MGCCVIPSPKCYKATVCPSELVFREPLKGCGDSSEHQITHSLLHFISILIMEHSPQALFPSNISTVKQIFLFSTMTKNFQTLSFVVLQEPTSFCLMPTGLQLFLIHVFQRGSCTTLQLIINAWNYVSSVFTQSLTYVRFFFSL